MKYAVAETMELEYTLTPLFQLVGFYSDQIFLFHLKIIKLNFCLLKDFNNINGMKCNNVGYGV